MAKEIEYKFLVDKDLFMKEENKTKYLHSRQGYFDIADESVSSFRIALIDHFYPQKWSDAILNIKGKRIGASRTEVETELKYEEGQQLFNMTKHRVEKDRYKAPAKASVDGLKWEVDIYYEDNFPLAIAELEVPDENVTFEKPEWVLEDVTSKDIFYNAELAKHPYKDWGSVNWM